MNSRIAFLNSGSFFNSLSSDQNLSSSFFARIGNKFTYKYLKLSIIVLIALFIIAPVHSAGSTVGVRLMTQ